MNKCTRAPTHTCVNEFSCRRQAPAYYFSSPGPSRAVCCFTMSKSAQAERKTKARFQALLRRSRFSRRSLRERLSLAVSVRWHCKVRNKKPTLKGFIFYRPANRPTFLEIVRQTARSLQINKQIVQGTNLVCLIATPYTLTPLHPYICGFGFSMLGVGKGVGDLLSILYYILYIL